MEEIKSKGVTDTALNQSADSLLKGLTQALERMNDIRTKDKKNISRTYDMSYLRSSERRTMQNDFDRRQKTEGDRHDDKEVPGRGRDSERRSQSMPPRREEKSPSRTAIRVSSRTTSFEDLSSASFPPGRPPPITGRNSPYNLPNSSSPTPGDQVIYTSSPTPGDQAVYTRDTRSKSPTDYGRVEGSGRFMSRSLRMSDPPFELPISPEQDAYERSRRERARSPSETERKHIERSLSPYERLRTEHLAERSRPDGQGQERVQQRNNPSQERQNASGRTEKPHTEFGRPRFSQSLYSQPEAPSRMRTMSEQPLTSFLPGQGREMPSPILNGKGSPRNSELSVSFQDEFSNNNERFTDGRKSPSHLDLAYSRSRSYRTRENKHSSHDNEEESEPKTLRGVSVDLRTAQKQLKEIRALSEDARTQLMLTEFKRDNTVKDLERMKEDLLRKKKQVKEYEDQLRFRTGDMRERSHMDDQTEALLQENESLKHRLRQADGLELERDELVRQLELAKEDLFNEQRQARNRVEELKDEVENLTSQLEETKSPHSDFLRRIRKLELENAKLLSEKEELSKDTPKSSTRGDFEKRYGREVEKLRVESDDLLSNLRKVQNEADTVNSENKLLRERIGDLEDKLNKERSAKDGVIDDHKRSLQNLRKEMDTAMVQLRENLFLDKQQALEELRQSMDKTRRTDFSRAEDKLRQTVTDHQGVLKYSKKKDGEITELMDIIQRLEAEKEKLEHKNKYDVQQKVEEALNEEKKKMVADREWMVLREREQMEHENRVKFKDMTNELEQERKQREQLAEHLNQTNKELEDQRLQNKHAMHDKMAAIARVKDQMRHETLNEIDKVKEKLKQEHRMEIDRLQDTIRKQEDELCQLRAERKGFLRPELENTLDRVERTIVNEINEEVRRNSGLIGIPAKKVDARNFSMDNDSFTTSGRGRTPTTAALRSKRTESSGEANLRSCNQELRTHVHQLKKELELQKSALIRVEREKDDLVRNVKTQLEKEKNKETDKMKEKLLQTPAQQQMNGVSHVHKPSNLTNVHYNNSNGRLPLQTYHYNPSGNIQRQEIERLEREIRTLAENQRRAFTSPVRSSYDDVQSEKMINQLESKIRQLQDENQALRVSKYNSTSTPNLSNPDLYRSSMSVYRPTHQEKLVNFLEQRSKEGLLDSDTAAEHQQRNRNMMSQKMYEMTKLQNSLTDQAKELIHLGQSYQQLNNRASPTRDLNMTR